MSRKKLEAEQIIPTSTTPPADRGFYKIARDKIGIKGDLVKREADGSLSPHVTATTKNGVVTGLVAGGNRLGPLDIGGGAKYCALIGDSIAEQHITTQGYRARGVLNYALCYMGWPWVYSGDDNFAVGGTSLDATLSSQLPSLIAAAQDKRYSRVFISAGTNDTNTGRSVQDIQSDFLALFAGIASIGAIPVMWGVLPRGADGAMTVAKRKNLAINEWLYRQSENGLLEFIDVSSVFADTTTAYGNAVAAMMYDSVLHPSDKGAALAGKIIADYYGSAGVAPGLKFSTQQADVFDRTDNPHGVAFNSPNPLLQGGTTAPTGMSTAGGVWSKVSRTLANGQTRSDPQCVLAAGTTHYLYDDWVATGAWSASQLQPGDVVEGRAMVEIIDGVDLKSVVMELNENNGSGGLQWQCLSAGSPASVPDGSHTLYMRTPPTTIRAYAGSGNAAIFAKLSVETGASGSGTIVVKAFEARKVG